MKKTIFTLLAASATLVNYAQQKNSLLDQNFWKNKPSVEQIKTEIANGNNPSASNDRSFDVVVMAINNDASTETILFLLQQPGNDVNKPTHDNRIYLHWAANKGNTAVVKYLIDHGSDINAEDSHATTPIIFAASSGQKNTEIYDLFFKKGLDPKKKYKDGANLLLLAIANDKDLNLTTYFTTKGLSLKDTDAKGRTAFDYAARNGNIDFLKLLASKNVKATDNALLLAAQGSRRDANGLDVFRYLLDDTKLKPTATTENGETVLHLVANKPKQSEIINYFIGKGVDVNKADNEGTTALTIAAGNRDTEALEVLIGKTKNVNTKNEKGISALTLAVAEGSSKAVEILLQQGADINVLDSKQNNLGYYLVQSYKPERGGRGPQGGMNTPTEDPFQSKMSLLQQKGLNLATPQKDGNTLYHFAILKNDIALLKKFAPLHIDVNAKNNDGLTVLHKAAMIAKDDATLKYLLSIGAKKEVTTDFDESVYALAKENETLTKRNISIEFLK